MDPKFLHVIQARNAKRYEFLCECDDPIAIDLIAERIGCREALGEFIDLLIAEKKDQPA